MVLALGHARRRAGCVQVRLEKYKPPAVIHILAGREPPHLQLLKGSLHRAGLPASAIPASSTLATQPPSQPSYATKPACAGASYWRGICLGVRNLGSAIPGIDAVGWKVGVELNA